MSAWADAVGAARFVAGLPGFFRRTPVFDPRRGLAQRSASFLRVMSRAVFGQPSSPYRKLLDHAGVGPRDLGELVAAHGVEGALGRLHEAGVFVTLDEFKGRRPVRRGSLRIETGEAAFDNPLLRRHYAGATSGSRGAGRRLRIDLDLLERECAHLALFADAYGLQGAPLALWRPAPLATAGLKSSLRWAKLGQPPQRWFSQTCCTGWKARFLVLAASGAGSRFPLPEHTPPSEASKVARWLAAETAAGRPAGLDAPVSSAVRVCLAARHDGLDISGSFFRVGGEPLTPAKLAVIRGTGSRVAVIYSMSEVGMIGVACAEGCCADDVHLLEDKLAAVERPVRLGETRVPALFLTTLSADCPKLMLNVESGDSAVCESRECGCPFGAAGFRRHLHSIRSYEKLCTEGMCFLGTELLQLVDEILPAEFGGCVGDYQMVETEADGITRVELVVAPSIGPVDEPALVRRCLDVLGRVPGGGVMTGVWDGAGTLRVARREVRNGVSGKLQPLLVPRADHGLVPRGDAL